MNFVLAANWKMHKSPSETEQFFQELNRRTCPQGVDLVFFVPSVNAPATSGQKQGQTWSWGPQNFYPEVQGAFTGETSAAVMKELGAEWALVGHSERRQIFLEADDFLNRKMKTALSLGLFPCLCVGETLAERKSGATLRVVEAQLAKGLTGLDQSTRFAVAYEPVWAIGTGEVARVEQVEEVHKAIQAWLAQKFSPAARPVLYGGSVKADNAAELSSLSVVHGFLVGGASLQVDSLMSIASQLQR